MQQRCIISNWMRTCTAKTQDLMMITLAQLYFFYFILSLWSNCSSLPCAMAVWWCWRPLKILTPANEYALISPASLPLQRDARRKAKLNGDANTSDDSAGEEMSLGPDRFLLLWCQTLRHRPAGSHGIIRPQQEKPWRGGKRLSPLTMSAGQPKVWTADGCFADFYFRNCKNTRV